MCISSSGTFSDSIIDCYSLVPQMGMNTKVECRGAIYSATDGVWEVDSTDTSLSRVPGGSGNTMECRCIADGSTAGSATNVTRLVCSMIVTTCSYYT